MSIMIKKVRITKEISYDILLCRGSDKFYINVAEGLNVHTVANNIDNLDDAKQQFLNLVWDIS